MARSDALVEEESRSSSPTGRNLRELQVLSAVSEAVSTSKDADETYGRIARIVSTILTFDRFSIASRNDAGSFTDFFVLDRQMPRWRKGETFRLRGPVAAELVEDSQVERLIDQLLGRPEPGTGPSFPDRFRSFLRVPVDFRGRNIGLLALRSERPRAYNRRHLALVTQISRRIAPTVAYLQILGDSPAGHDQAAAVLRSRRALLQGVAERLQNPLSAARFAAGLVTEQIRAEGSDGNALRAAELLERSLHRVERVVDRSAEWLSIATRGRDITCKQFDPTDIISRLISARSELRLRKGLSISCSLPARGLDGYGDRQLIERCLEELVDNAFRHALPGTTIHISGRVDGLWISIDVANACAVRGGDVAVADPAPLCAPSSVLTAGAPSAGMGLCIADAVVRAHGSELSIISSNGTFRIQARFPSGAAPGISARPEVPTHLTLSSGRTS